VSANVARAPLVAAVKRHSLEDGPGIRTVVFLKGCPLRCTFCQNPETQDARAEIAFTAGRCLRCGRCAAACPRGAADPRRPERIDRTACDRCGRCAEVCPGGALRRIGQAVAPEALVERLLRDRPFWARSGGGVTFSGGECLLFPEYVGRAAALLAADGVHVAVQTAGVFDYPRCARHVWPHVRLAFFDVKLADPRLHRRHCGGGHGRILRNLRRLLAEPGLEVRPRVPLVPGVTDAPGNLEGIVRLLAEAGGRSLTLLPYNPLGLGAGERLGRRRPELPERLLTADEERAARDRVRSAIDALRGAGVPPKRDGGPGGGEAPPEAAAVRLQGSPAVFESSTAAVQGG
jgi:pyruvate formate lyase activating enzyme